MTAQLLLRPTTTASALIVVSGALFGVRGVLKADGIFKVKGADFSTAIITVVPEGAAAYSVASGTHRFTLELPLDDTYLVNFERAGCPSKQVYFDTRVPAEHHAAEFSFPFQVTLEHVAAEHMFAYDAPVGYVRYMQPDIDFGYETMYLVKVDNEMQERLASVLGSGTDTKVFAAPSASLVVDHARNGSFLSEKPADDGEGTVAPQTSEVPQLVHVTSLRSVIATVVEPVKIPATAEPLENLVVAPVIEEEKPIAAVEAPMQRMVAAKILQPRPEDALAPAVDPGAASRSANITISSVFDMYTRQDELITEGRRVTHIVRMTSPDGNVNEYRQVTHAYGGVFYFHNMDSITQRDFNGSVARK